VVWVMDDDNMDPFIRRNELLIIDNSFKKIKGGGIYAFRNQEEKIKIRRIYEKLEGGIDILNDNRAYESYSITSQDLSEGGLKVLGRVVFVGKPI
jgi:phage repressor protein C with HTH and peptisase S24 domain